MKSTTDLGNLAFMATICTFAVIGATATAILGFTNLALVIVFTCTFVGTFIAVFVENMVNKYVAKKQKEMIEEYTKFEEK